jgi:ABC-2 type transport system permease protein
MSPHLHKDVGWRLFIRTVLGRAYPRVFGYAREPVKLLIDVALPLIALFAYVFVYRAIHAPEVFIGYVILGGAMSAYWINVLWGMSSQFFWERQIGNLALYIMAPSSLMAILLGMAIGGIVIATMRAAVIVLLGAWLFHIKFMVQSVPMVVLVFLLTVTALYAMGMMFASLFLLFGREARHFVELSQEPAYLLTGTYFPIKSLNFWVASAASLIPLTLGLDAMRQLVFASGGASGTAATGFLSAKIECMALFVLSAIFLVGAHHSLKYMERLAVAEGKLTESRA